MRQSHLFSHTRREAPKDEASKNARILVRGGFIHKEMAGVYSFLPLGLRVISRINNIIREEMNAIGGEEILMSTLQSEEVWKKSGRWDDEAVSIWMKTKLKSGAEVGLGFTHEEPIVNMLKNHISSHKDLPVYVYQIQNKFRNETRAKSGLMRTREFLMKDLYSFSKDEDSHAKFYGKVKEAYFKVFNRVGLGGKTHLTYASGGSFSKYSHEFQTLTDAGEDHIHICTTCKTAVNEEIIHEHKICPECSGKDFKKEKAVEVGNIFNLGTRFSEALELFYRDDDGKEKAVVMGSYGIGPGRVMGTIAEIYSDLNSLVWPESVSPYAFHLIALSGKNSDITKEADKIYHKLTSSGVSVLFDDREISAGEKFADADLIGIPKRLVLGERSLSSGKLEYKNRVTGEEKNLSLEELLGEL